MPAWGGAWRGTGSPGRGRSGTRRGPPGRAGCIPDTRQVCTLVEEELAQSAPGSSSPPEPPQARPGHPFSSSGGGERRPRPRVSTGTHRVLGGAAGKQRPVGTGAGPGGLAGPQGAGDPAAQVAGRPGRDSALPAGKLQRRKARVGQNPRAERPAPLPIPIHPARPVTTSLSLEEEFRRREKKINRAAAEKGQPRAAGGSSEPGARSTSAAGAPRGPPPRPAARHARPSRRPRPRRSGFSAACKAGAKAARRCARRGDPGTRERGARPSRRLPARCRPRGTLLAPPGERAAEPQQQRALSPSHE